jgi:hypothetical protein
MSRFISEKPVRARIAMWLKSEIRRVAINNLFGIMSYTASGIIYDGGEGIKDAMGILILLFLTKETKFI